jgi:hypothetical protein
LTVLSSKHHPHEKLAIVKDRVIRRWRRRLRLVGTVARPTCCSRAAGALRARLGPAGPAGVLLVVCPADNRRSLVEMGSSRSAELLSHVLVLSCILTLRAARYCSRRDGDGGCKIVVAHAYGGEDWWWCFGAFEFFCGWGREKSLSACPTLMRCRFRVAPFFLGGRRGKPPSTLL